MKMEEEQFHTSISEDDEEDVSRSSSLVTEDVPKEEKPEL